MYEPIHEFGDEALRPTNKPWKCQKCGIELYLVDTIVSHKERCKGKPKPILKPKNPREIEHEKLLEQSLKEFKENQGIR